MWRTRELREFYEERGKTETRYGRGGAAGLFHQLRLNAVGRALEKLRGRSAIDVGAGEGVIGEEVGNRFESVLSFDLSRGYLRRTSTGPRVQGSLTDPPFEDDAFDAVVACDVLEHVPDFDAALESCVRMAREHVLVSVPLDGFHRRLARLVGMDVETYDDRIGHLHVYPYDDFRRRVEERIDGELTYEDGLYVTPALLWGGLPAGLVERVNRGAWRAGLPGKSWVVQTWELR